MDARSMRSLMIGLFALIVSTTNMTLLFSQQPDKYRDARMTMVQDEIIREGVKDPRVLEAMRTVPRHLFVTADLRQNAYFDAALPIGHKQTISPPYIVAYMTEMLDPQPEDRVLEIGTGSGYQAAVLSRIVKEVYTIEIVPELGENAAKLLREIGYTNVYPVVADGYKGWPKYAPFDKIIVTCSPEKVPEPLVEQLKDGGKMIVPVGERYEQAFYLFEKHGGKLEKKRLLSALFVPMTGIAEDKREVQPDPANPQIHNGNFEILGEETGRPVAWHYQRQTRLETGDAPNGKAYLTFENDTPGRGAQILQGLPLDGSKVSTVEVKLHVRAAGLKFGTKPYERPGLILHFYDADRRLIGEDAIGPWRTTFNWREVSKILHVPPKAREAVLRIGLNGATGTLSIDDVRLKASK